MTSNRQTTDKQPTSNRQATDKQATTIEEIKEREEEEEVKKEKKEEENITVSNETVYQTDVRLIVDTWNELQNYGIRPISRLDSGSRRYQSLMARIKQYSTADVLSAIDRIKSSDFLQGRNGNGWTITFDWFVLPNNFPKVLEGNYDNGNRHKTQYHSQTEQMLDNSYSMMSEWVRKRGMEENSK